MLEGIDEGKEWRRQKFSHRNSACQNDCRETRIGISIPDEQRSKHREFLSPDISFTDDGITSKKLHSQCQHVTSGIGLCRRIFRRQKKNYLNITQQNFSSMCSRCVGEHCYFLTASCIESYFRYFLISFFNCTLFCWVPIQFKLNKIYKN